MAARSLSRIVRGFTALSMAATVMVACSGSDDTAKKADGTDTRGGTTPTTAPANPDVDLVLTVGDEATAQLDDRFQSYNVEMVEVTGGYFWPPYEAGGAKVYREPIDLSSERLRNLAKALGPVYIRVSGTWANSTYFDAEGTTGGTPPAGYEGVLTAEQWRGVGEFARFLDSEVVTSFAGNTGSRDGAGVWTDTQARLLLEFSQDNDVPVVAAEFFNEPNLNIGVPRDQTADTFARDFEVFRAMVEEVQPDLLIVGPGGSEDVTPMIIDAPIKSREIFERVSPAFDVVSYHFYPKVSERCGNKEQPDVALTEEFLSRVDVDRDFYEALRDEFEPDAPMWITETAEAACGGDRWAATFRDVIRYVDNNGRLARGDGDAVFHNTLAASDYGLLDEDGFVPRPNYWAAVLWHQLMGPTVVAPPAADPKAGLNVYAQCTPGDGDPSVTYAVVNPSPTETRTVATGSGAATVYRLTGDLDGTEANLNGKALTAAENGTVPEMSGEKVTGSIEIAPASVAFVVEPTTSKACA